MLQVYADVTNRTLVFADRELLKVAELNNILGQFGQKKILPSKSSKTIVFRRFNKLSVSTSPLGEGVTPTGNKPTVTDVTCNIAHYGNYIPYSDEVLDINEDPLLEQYAKLSGYQSSETWDVLRAGVLKAGTNVLYATGTQRTDVNAVITHAKVRTAVRILKAEEAKPLREIVVAGVNVATKPIAPAFIAVCHSNVQPDLEALGSDVWIPVQNYASIKGLINGEAGAIGEVRFVFDNNLTAWADAGAAVGGTGTLSTTEANSDVYPILIFGADAYGTVSLGGKESVQTVISVPKGSDSDPLAQRGSYGWKGWTGTVILNDDWMIRLEVAIKG